MGGESVAELGVRIDRVAVEQNDAGVEHPPMRIRRHNELGRGERVGAVMQSLNQ